MVLPGEDELSQPSSGPAQDVPARDTCHHCRAEFEIPEEMLRAAEEKQLAILKSNVATESFIWRAF